MKRIALVGALLALAAPSAAIAKNPAAAERASARDACKELRSSMGKRTFRESYGTPGKNRKARGRCVRVMTNVVEEARSNAAHECKAERDDPNFAANHDGKTFEQYYGTNKNGKNAYGKCVSSKSSDKVDEQVEANENAAKACKAERDDPAFADSHDGKTFAEYYGTNKNKKNAFGKCVSSKAKEQQEPEAQQG